MCLKNNNDIFDCLIEKIKNKFSSSIDIFSACPYRNTIQACMNYKVDYIMEKSDNPYNLYDNKYAMFVRWGKSHKYAIIIGQNPAQAKTIKGCMFNVDDTNWNIVKILSNNNYDGYVMLNTFPEIDSKGKKFLGGNVSKKQQNLNIKISKRIIKFLKNTPIILACTTKNYISKTYFNAIVLRNKVKYIASPYITHFATQTLGKITPYYNAIILQPAFPKIMEEKKEDLCKIKF